jgi:ribosomal-protein-alanine N-acetyltransferase
VSVWIGDDASAFAAGLRRLFRDEGLRKSIARAAREHAERHFDWRKLGLRQRALWAELLGLSVLVREACEEDLKEIAAIQAASPEAAAWDPAGYLDYGCLVGVRHGRVAGFFAYREAGPGECEILNLAVAPEARRRGMATALAGEVTALAGGAVFLEVRCSNAAARKLYEKLGFRQVGLRKDYYHSPPEDGIVMRFQPC